MSLVDDHRLLDGNRALNAVPDYVEEQQPERRFSVIEGIDRAAQWIRYLGTTLLVTFVVGLVGALVLHATLIENQRGLDDRRAELNSLRAETESLRHQLAELEAPARIVEEARRLGMIEAPAVTYLQVPADQLDDRTLRVAENQLGSR